MDEAEEVKVYLTPEVVAMLDEICDRSRMGRSQMIGLLIIEDKREADRRQEPRL